VENDLPCALIETGDLCITGTEIANALPYFLVFVLVVGVYAIIRHERRKHWGYHKKPGVEPGQGSTVIDVSYGPITGGRGAAYIHSQDPQAHARAFVPDNKTTKD
jgi:hypothetical protein